MTWVFDALQTFLGHIKTVKDPELFATAIGYVSRIMASVHDVDHTLFGNDNKIAKALERTSAYERIKEFNAEAERRKVNG